MNAFRSRIQRWGESPWPPTLAAVVFLLGMIGCYAYKYDGRLTALIHLGRMFMDPARVPESYFVWGPEGHRGSGSEGYDGQFFYYMALQPFQVHRANIDNPPYRAQRILYPVMAHVVAGGNPHLVPYSLLIVNLGALLLTVWWMAGLAVRAGRSSWWSLAGVISIGTLLPTTFCLGEPLGVACVVGAIAATVRGKLGWTFAGLALSVLAREQMVVIMPIFGLYWWKERGWRQAWWVMGVPWVIWGIWQGWGYQMYGIIPVFSKEYSLWGWPGMGWATRLHHLVTKGHSHCEGPELFFLLWFAAATVITVREWVREGFRISLGWSLAAVQIGLALVLNHILWESMTNHARQVALLPVGLMIWEGERPAKAKRALLWASVIIGVAWLLCDLHD